MPIKTKHPVKVCIVAIEFRSLNLTHYQVWTSEHCIHDSPSREKCVEWVTQRGHRLVSSGEIACEHDRNHGLDDASLRRT